MNTPPGTTPSPRSLAAAAIAHSRRYYAIARPYRADRLTAVEVLDRALDDLATLCTFVILDERLDVAVARDYARAYQLVKERIPRSIWLRSDLASWRR